MMWNWATLGLIHSNTTWSKVWALGFARIGKLFVKMQTFSFGSDFSTHEFSARCNVEKTWFLPIQRSDFLFYQNNWSFLINHSRNFAKICYFIENSTFLPFWGKNSTILLWNRNGKKTLIQRMFMDKLTQIHQIFKIPNHHFLMINSSG
jgi:hypothetical protein